MAGHKLALHWTLVTERVDQSTMHGLVRERFHHRRAGKYNVRKPTLRSAECVRESWGSALALQRSAAGVGAIHLRARAIREPAILHHEQPSEEAQ